MREKRRKIWIDRFQTFLCLRIAAYLVIYQAAVWSLVAIERSLYHALAAMVGTVATSYFVLLTAATVLALGFLFTYDAMKDAHRLVGPLYRFRQTIKAITAGNEVPLVQLRKGDWLEDMRDEFNEMLKVLEQRGAVTLKQPQAKAQPKEPVSV
jgi:nitrogen fixation/metabolism regulation signal transduction histidine kinase